MPDTTNKFAVSLQGENIAILMPARVVSRDDALNLAAWLVAIANPPLDDFGSLVEAIWNT